MVNFSSVHLLFSHTKLSVLRGYGTETGIINLY